MTQDLSNFDTVLFIADGASAPLLDTKKFPYMFNDNGRGRQTEDICGRLIELAPDAPELERGATYRDIAHWPRQITPKDYPAYEITEFDFRVPEVRYEPLPATPENAQAFGATLLRSGECIRFPYDGLVMSDYTYGKWAGYESPYLGDGRSRELLTWNATDLEYHDFAHIFFSQGPLPLVITVARWRPYVNQISLADLWVAPGDALVLPPKVMPPPPTQHMGPEEKRRLVVDMHNNRNSAQACRRYDGPPSLATATVLGDDQVMSAPLTRPYYHEEKQPTWHGMLKWP
ncbi:hypothetical protein [Herbaspirillum robiniae]|uniref:DUF2169 domain-containing protein n=1 Tax=Herbaspirillum robiniae TaxID=2014887 RepID=A0A246WKA8_9BURK|nr:hypothetical protein [Herbaspirillum robiniae]NUU01011.1 hypothetical protein [Herbaspirillum robiniae]OWY26577.1 hypothetical protein CEJ42_23540 [Herbaspirillum robiniae]